MSVYIRYVADGFREDFERVLNVFISKNSFEFSDFSELWKDTKFSLIYMGRESEKEMREFTVECFNIILGYISPISIVRMKVGAVFFLYSTYVKQPLCKYKIRLQINQWLEIKLLFEFAKKEGHLSLCYVISELLRINAFHFVALPKLMGPRVTIANGRHVSFSSRLENYRSRMKEFVDSGELVSLATYQEKYEAAKANITNTYGNKLDILLENKFLSIHMDFDTLSGADDYEKVLYSGTPKSPSSSEIGLRRATLKQTQFEKRYETGISRRRGELMSLTGDESNINVNEDGEPVPGPLLESPIISPPKLKKKKKPRRLPKHERKPGRPKRKPESEKEEEQVDQPEIIDPFLCSVPEIPEVRPRPYHRRMIKPRKTRCHYAGDSDSDTEQKGGFVDEPTIT